MGMGVLGIIAATIRLVLSISEIKAVDFPFASYQIVIWTSVEVCTGLVCAAAPATRPFLRLIAPGFLANEPSHPVDNTAARRRNYADGTVHIVELGSQGTVVTGASGSSYENGSQKLWDLGGLLKDDVHSVKKGGVEEI
jgi:hypothetical protein